MFQPEEVIIDYLVMDSCEENNDGSISTNVSGGTLPYVIYGQMVILPLI